MSMYLFDCCSSYNLIKKLNCFFFFVNSTIKTFMFNLVPWSCSQLILTCVMSPLASRRCSAAFVLWLRVFECRLFIGGPERARNLHFYCQIWWSETTVISVLITPPPPPAASGSVILTEVSCFKSITDQSERSNMNGLYRKIFLQWSEEF